MASSLSFEAHLDVVARSAAALREHAVVAGTGADVPTCPRWTVADLLAHIGIVHRWAAANLRREPDPSPSKTAVLREVPADELVEWSRAGTDALLATFREVAADVDAMVFLNDAPRPREFWARRQAHETTVHAVDALAAALGRMPTAAEVGVDADVAADGVDELLRGFFMRGRSKLADGVPFTIAVTPSDSPRRWTMRIDGERLTTTEGGVVAGGVPDDGGGRDDADGEVADAVFGGTAAQLYLGLWNRGEEIVATGREDVLVRWRKVQRVRWS